MSTAPKIIPKPVIIGFFLLGLLSSVAFRAIILLQKYEPTWVRPVWYFGVLGYMAFFMYRYFISQRRKHAIAHSDIIEKIRIGATLNNDERDAALYLLKSVRASQEDWNYLAIFVLSIVAIALDLLLPGK
jgi:short subunit fatty acids transporter